MYWKHQLQIYLICVLIAGQPAISKTLTETINDFLSFKLPEDLFASVNENILGKLQAKNIKFILPNQIEMDDMEVLDHRGERMLYGKHVKLSLSLISLLTNNIRITDAYVDSPFFRYTIYDDVHNVVRAFESPPSSAIPSATSESESKMRVTIEKVAVKNGNYEMFHDAGVEIFAEGISAQGKFYVESGPFGVDISEVHIERGGILTGGMDLPITNLVARDLWISDEKVSTKTLIALYEKAKLTGQGTVYIDDEKYDINAQLNAPKGTYPAGLKPLPFIAPAFTAAVKMTGPLIDPQFATNVQIADTDFLGLAIKEGQIAAQINQHRIQVNSAQLKVGHIGSISGQGKVDLDQKQFVFSSKQKNILGAELANFLSFDENTRGLINGKTELTGSFSGPDPNIHIISLGQVFDGGINDITWAPQTNFDVNINLVLDKMVQITHAQVTDNWGLRLGLSGTGNLIKKSASLDVDLFCPDTSHYMVLKEKTAAKNWQAKGRVALDDNGLSINGRNKASLLTIADLYISDVNADIDLFKKRLAISKLSAKAYQGLINGNLVVDDFTDNNLLNGHLVLRELDLYTLSRPFSELVLGGKISSVMDIGGSLAQPTVTFSAEVEEPVIDRAKFRTAQFDGQLTDHRLTIPRFALLAKSGLLDGHNLAFDLKSKKISGNVLVADFNIGSTFTKFLPEVEGDLFGLISIDGTLDSPLLNAPLVARKLSAYGVELGDGSITLALARRPLLGQKLQEDLVFSVSSNLNRRGSTNIVRFSMALNKKTINADIELQDLELNSAALKLPKEYIGIVGRVSGNITAEGLLRAPTLSAHLIAKEYGFFDPQQREAAQNIKKMYGPAVLDAGLRGGLLDVELCASFMAPTGGLICGNEQALSLYATGSFALDQYSLDIEGRIDHTHIEDLIMPLKNELITINAAAGFKGKFIKKHKQSLVVNAKVDIDRLISSLPNIPNVNLMEPVSLIIANNAVELSRDATINFSPGELTINGSYQPTNMDIHLQGAIPLVLARLFIPLVQRAEGLAKGSIALSGSAFAPILEGSITPDPNSSLTLRKWLEPIEIKEGSVTFKRTSDTSFVTLFDQIRLAVGDGRLLLSGYFDKHYAKDAGLDSSKFDLDVAGSNIVIREGLNFVEADFKIKTELDQSGLSVAKGEIIVTDGSAHRQFDLRNFVAQAQTGLKPGLFKFLEDIDTRINLDIAVRQFRASARMLNLDIESTLRGQMTVEGPLYHPKFKGALFVSEGAINFPSLSFDLVESQIVLDENSPRIFDPKIELVATQELEKVDFPQISLDTTIELTLRGDLDRLNLELRPIRGDLRLSQLKIFLLLLSPRSMAGLDSQNQFELLKRGAQNAAMAFSGEVFLRPLTNELQELLEGKTKTRIQFGSAWEPGAVTLRINWKLGPRIELQGSYMFLTEDPRNLDKDSPLSMDNQTLLSDIKLKLLLFDHPPAGPLSLETSLGSTQRIEGKYEPLGKIRLKYRVLSK